jgi:hypothetical protein
MLGSCSDFPHSETSTQSVCHSASRFPSESLAILNQNHADISIEQNAKSVSATPSTRYGDRSSTGVENQKKDFTTKTPRHQGKPKH